MSESDDVLMHLIQAVNATGGVITDDGGDPVACVGDGSSRILADMYLRACAVLGEEEVTRREPTPARATAATTDPVTCAFLALPGAQYHPTGGGCGVILVSTDRYIFGIGGDDIASPPNAHDVIFQISVYPRFGRTDPVEIFADTQYGVPTFSLPATTPLPALLAQLQAYEMPREDRMRVIRACGEYQTDTYGETGRYAPGTVRFEHEGVGVCDPFSDEGGMREVDPDIYYGEAFRSSAFFR
jgi:hypothetical protein